VGARALAIRNKEGSVVAAWKVPVDALASLERGQVVPQLWEDARIIDFDVGDGRTHQIYRWTTPLQLDE